MSGARSVPTDYGRSRVTARTRWRAGRRGRRDAAARITTEHYAQQVQLGLELALGELRSRFHTEHAALIERLHAEAARIVTEYDQRHEQVPTALARFGGWVAQWRTAVTACQQRGLALAACADQELAHYEAAYARKEDRIRVPLEERAPTTPPGERPSAAVLDETWTGEPDWRLDTPPVPRALRILEQEPVAGTAGPGEWGMR
ncbi:hypothetical protein [Streptomyces aurantiogriseus]|uniref:Uncharacterized protein n=1 Tax=Streptomyces aurantiogriseus TaxID=66870 RepID=A0A918F412_9ACTN|nr:hypothetical protein [Streptomyces aurantiogriseus]GGQ99380.1 hypothetical protein GCM10010251_13080 [Streptomyces aurantiogriseus]